MTDPKYRRSFVPIDPVAYRAQLIAAGLLRPGPEWPPRVDDGAKPLPKYKTRALEDAARLDRDDDR